MTIDRREFLSSMAAGAVAATHPALAFARQNGNHKIDKIGLQLYTVRTEMEKSVDATIGRVAAAGYREVEFAGYFNHPPQAIKGMLSKHGLTAPSTHIAFANIDTNWAEVLETSKTIGHQFIVIPYLDDATRAMPDVWKKVAAGLNKAGEATKKAGMQLAYHNHNFEFVPGADGKLPFDFLLAECDPKLVQIEMDLCWMVAAGQDPVKYFNAHPGRFPMVHVKDLKKVPASAAVGTGPVIPDITEVGAGLINWKQIFAGATKAGIKHYFVEHDQPASPFDSIATSIKYLQALRY